VKFCDLHTNNPLLDMVLQLCNNQYKIYCISMQCSIHLFMPSWCQLFAIFTWWSSSNIHCVVATWSYSIHVSAIG